MQDKTWNVVGHSKDLKEKLRGHLNDDTMVQNLEERLRRSVPSDSPQSCRHSDVPERCYHQLVVGLENPSCMELHNPSMEDKTSPKRMGFCCHKSDHKNQRIKHKSQCSQILWKMVWDTGVDVFHKPIPGFNCHGSHRLAKNLLQAPSRKCEFHGRISQHLRLWISHNGKLSGRCQKLRNGLNYVILHGWVATMKRENSRQKPVPLNFNFW